MSLLKLPENYLCADCKKHRPKWASCNLGIFICLECSGIHRSLGTHISFVRSCNLDSWEPEQEMRMKYIGNQKANDYWEYNLPPDFQRPDPNDRSSMERFIRDKYVNKKWINPSIPGPHELPISKLTCRSDEEILSYSARADEEKSHPDYSIDDLLDQIDNPTILQEPEVKHVQYESVTFEPPPEENKSSNTQSKNRLAALQSFFGMGDNHKTETHVEAPIKAEEETKQEQPQNQQQTSKFGIIAGGFSKLYGKVSSLFTRNNNNTPEPSQEETTNNQEFEYDIDEPKDPLADALSDLQAPDTNALENFFNEHACDASLIKENPQNNPPPKEPKYDENINLLEVESTQNKQNEENDFAFLPTAEPNYSMTPLEPDIKKNSTEDLEDFFSQKDDDEQLRDFLNGTEPKKPMKKQKIVQSESQKQQYDSFGFIELDESRGF
ncbi:ARF GAP-like zinc finger-containing protein [Histomonas meleagridis]|uniref:ARF GAP-like zinc finger-containing protein n=1 Tax=Histomonas meleagridis TaxID=135588 RepID=UPI00355A4D0D|nr:ARF GAP-like zinc finger-containing protein [Histomonas meleagridis]KAH0803810.1 ARF GAP-like zinc finger-containing protein [Histomonas meleagridis]